MYHDQVLTPLKTLYEYDAINITLGLPFLRVSPDHSNEHMLGKNKSNPLSLMRAISFLDKIDKSKKSLGQNFLVDDKILSQIVSCVEIKNKNILKIGPGTKPIKIYFKTKKIYCS